MIMEAVEAAGLLTAIGPTVFSAALGKECKGIVDSEDSNKAHLLWVYPVHLVVTVLTLAIQPALAVIALVVTPILKLIGCCSDKCDEIANDVFNAAIASFSLRPQLLIRLINPSFELKDKLELRNLEHRRMSLVNFVAAPTSFALLTGNLHSEYTEKNRAHALWTCPLNGIVTILAIAAQPILSVIAIVAAAIFRQLGCCSDEMDEVANKIFHVAVAGFTAIPQLFVRIINPAYALEDDYSLQAILRA